MILRLGNKFRDSHFSCDLIKTEVKQLVFRAVKFSPEVCSVNDYSKCHSQIFRMSAHKRNLEKFVGFSAGTLDTPLTSHVS